MDNSSLAHGKWNFKQHIVFAPKYRRQIIYGKTKDDVGAILRKLCDQKGVEIIEAIEEYIKNQIQEELVYEQMSLKEYIDPFTGEKVKKGK